MNILTQIRKLRISRNFSQRAMADDLKIGQSQYCRIENGETDICLSRLEKIAKLLKAKVRIELIPEESESAGNRSLEQETLEKEVHLLKKKFQELEKKLGSGVG